MSAFAGVGAFAQIWGAGVEAKQEQFAVERMKENARAIRRATAIKVKNIKRAGRLAVGAQRAAYAKSGVRIEGSPLEVLNETAIDAKEAAFEAFVEGRRAARHKEAEAEGRKSLAKARFYTTVIGSVAGAAGSGGGG